jgi:hypothetical protein
MTVAPTPLQHRATNRYRLLIVALLVLILAGVVVLLLFQHGVFKSSSTTTAVQGSGVAASQTRPLAPFAGVELAGSNVVTIHVGGKQSVVVHADDNLLSHVTTQVQNGALVIGNTPGTIASKSPMRVDIRMPSLAALRLTGSGVVAAEGIRPPRMTVALGGSGVIRATGKITRLDVTVSGSGDAQLRQLGAADVHAVVSGSGRILVTATRTLDASVPGTGAIVYRGNPRLTTSVTGNGVVTRG